MAKLIRESSPPEATLAKGCSGWPLLAVTKKSVDPDLERKFYVSMICQDGDVWRWATAEPATSRWGSLQ